MQNKKYNKSVLDIIPMNFKIDNRIFEKFPSLTIGVVVAKGIDNKGINKEVMKLLEEQERKIKETFNSETLSENPKIHTWREAYSSFGAKPKKYRCSVENLYRTILDNIPLNHINTLVDLYNVVSIKHTVPVGGDDIDKVDGDIVLTIAYGTETFSQLNSEEVNSPKPQEIIYRDDKEVLCRRWNWRESDKSKMTEDTKNVALVIEGLYPVTKKEIETITQELSSLLHTFCGGKIKSYVIDGSIKEIEI